MKKFVCFILLCLTIVPLFAAAEAKIHWDDGISCKVNANGTSATFTNITTSYSSGFLDIMPAVQELIGSNEAITITVSGKIKAEFEKPNVESSCRPIIRNRVNFDNAQSWYDELYIPHLYGAEPFFSVYGTNVSKSFLDITFPLKSDWSEFSFSFNANRSQIYCSVSSQWFFCIDSIKLENTIKSISIENVTVTAKAIEGATPPPTPIPTPTPAPTPTFRLIRTPQAIVKFTPTPTLTPTPTPTPAPTPNWLVQPAAIDMMLMIGASINCYVGIIVIIGTLYIALTLRAKKK